MEAQQASAPKDMKNVIDFLRGTKSGLKNKTGVLSGSRREYFKGKSALKALQSDAYSKLKNVPTVDPTDDESAKKVLADLIRYAFFFRVERGNPSGSSSSSPRHIQINPQQEFNTDYYYVWFYDGPQWKNYLGAALLVVVMLAGVMFPLWPVTLRIGVWYLSMAGFGVIGLFIAMSIFRLIFYIITVVVASPGIWIFPKLFADVGFIESFIPGWDWDIPPPKKQKKKRGEKEEGANGEKIRKRKNGTSAPGVEGVPSNASLPTGATIEEVADDE